VIISNHQLTVLAFKNHTRVSVFAVRAAEIRPIAGFEVMPVDGMGNAQTLHRTIGGVVTHLVQSSVVFVRDLAGSF